MDKSLFLLECARRALNGEAIGYGLIYEFAESQGQLSAFETTVARIEEDLLELGLVRQGVDWWVRPRDTYIIRIPSLTLLGSGDKYYVRPLGQDHNYDLDKLINVECYTLR